MKLALLLLLVLGAVGSHGVDAPPAGVDEKLWKLLTEIDARGGKVQDLRADFTQQKFTPLLKRPLISTGTVLIKGSAALWTTTRPEPTVMRIDEKEVRLLYPNQKVMEIFAVDQKMGSLAASPFPRLEVLRKHFTFERIAVKELSPTADDAKQIALRMRPTEKELQKHIDEVAVLLEIETGLVVRAQTIDADGDRLVMSFANVRTNTGIGDAELKLDVPAGVRESRPMEGGGAGAGKAK